MIHALANARRLAGARIAVYAVWLADVATDPFPDLAALPRAWFSPHGPWALLPGAAVDLFWSKPALVGLKVVTLAFVALALSGVAGHRFWAATAALLLTVVTAFVRGFGHADHAQVQLLFLSYALVFLPAWDALSLRRDRAPSAAQGVYATSFAVLGLVFAVPYLATAVYRISHEGASIYFGSSMSHFIARDTLSLDHFEFTLGLALVETDAWRPWLNLGFAAVTLAELASPWAHLRRSWCVVWLAVLAPFHALSPVLMHVSFLHNMLLICVLYVWPLLWRAEPAAPRA